MAEIDRDATAPVLAVRDLRKRYGRIEALKGVSLEVDRGVLLGLLGPNGSGKSTLIRTIMNLQTPDSGYIRIFGRDPRKEHSTIYRRVGYMPELPNLPDFMSGRQFLEFVARVNGVPSGEIGVRVREMLELVGLSEAADRRIGKYSKGMVQRLGVAQALIHDPDLIVLDEPTLGMDPEGRVFFRELFRDLAREGKTILMSSHLLEDVEKTASHLAIIYRGDLLFFGEIDRALSLISGDHVVRVEVDGDPSRAAEALRGLGFVRDLSVDGSWIKIVVARDADRSFRREISEAIYRSGCLILAMETATVDLEQAYIKSLRDRGGQSRGPAA